jgi:hypothetical protein
MMSKNIAQNKKSSQGLINYPTQLHLVGYFRTLYHDARKHEFQEIQILYLPNNEENLAPHTNFRYMSVYTEGKR